VATGSGQLERHSERPLSAEGLDLEVEETNKKYQASSDEQVVRVLII
jgi:hypothetical protein